MAKMRKILSVLIWAAVAFLVLFNVALLWGMRLPR
jgi:ABC-type multidrug transport system permease subunit